MHEGITKKKRAGCLSVIPVTIHFPSLVTDLEGKHAVRYGMLNAIRIFDHSE